MILAPKVSGQKASETTSITKRPHEHTMQDAAWNGTKD